VQDEVAAADCRQLILPHPHQTSAIDVRDSTSLVLQESANILSTGYNVTTI